MIKSERAFRKAMRKAILCVCEGKNPLEGNPSREDLEVVAECVEKGFLFAIEFSPDEVVVRTADRKPHISLDIGAVPVKGLAFLRPDYTRIKANIAIAVSILALLISGLANAPEICATIRAFLKFVAESK